MSKPKKKGLLDRIPGIQTEAVPTADQQEATERHDKIRMAWQYLRDRIDKATKHYYATGSFDKLEEFVERPALDLMKEHLTRLRNEGVYWEQPTRQQITEPRIRVVSEELNKRGQPTNFIVEERFKDFSVYSRLQGDGTYLQDARADGRERTIQAHVVVRNATDFRLVSVIEVEQG